MERQRQAALRAVAEAVRAGIPLPALLAERPGQAALVELRQEGVWTRLRNGPDGATLTIAVVGS